MSRVTNVILTSYGDNIDFYIHEYVEALNKHCFAEDKTGFFPRDIGGSFSTGGSKYMIGCTLVGGFNYLNVRKFITDLRSFDWEKIPIKHHKQRPYSVDLFYLIEDTESGYSSASIYRR